MLISLDSSTNIGNKLPTTPSRHFHSIHIKKTNKQGEPEKSLFLCYGKEYRNT